MTFGSLSVRWPFHRESAIVCSQSQPYPFGMALACLCPVGGRSITAVLGKATDQAGVHVIIEPEYQYRVSIEDEELFVIRILHGREERT